MNDEEFKKLLNSKNFSERMLDFVRAKKINLNSFYNYTDEIKPFKDEFSNLDTDEMITEIKEASALLNNFDKDYKEIDDKLTEIKKDRDQLKIIISLLKEEFDKKHYK